MSSLNSNRKSRPSLLSGGDLPSDLTIINKTQVFYVYWLKVEWNLYAVI